MKSSSHNNHIIITVYYSHILYNNVVGVKIRIVFNIIRLGFIPCLDLGGASLT